MQQPAAAEIEKTRKIQVEAEKEAIELRPPYTESKLSVRPTPPPPIAKFWMGCPANVHQVLAGPRNVERESTITSRSPRNV